MKILLLLIVVLNFISSSSFAESLGTKTDRVERFSSSEFKYVMSVEDKAKSWSLSEEEWKRVEMLRQGDAKYQFSNLDPIELLGIYARNETERNKYALLLVKKNAKRFQRTLDFNEAYKLAGLQYFAGQPKIDIQKFYEFYGYESPNVEKSVKPQLGDTLVLFVNPNAPKSLHALQTMRDLMGLAPVNLEIYFLETTEEGVIQSWAKTAKINAEDVASKQITLNFDQGESQSFNISTKKNAAFIVRGGTAFPVTL